ncbi:MAG: sulfatase-like hydrolase/transferase [Candidatus Eisenbacteria bacterium]|nr:sulfatase-like hydrolase/transferase [Candidatus Eisenbacteria bacterium]
MRNRLDWLIAALLGALSGVVVGILWTLLFNPRLLIAYSISTSVYGLIGGICAALTAIVFSKFLSERWTIRIAGGGWAAVFIGLALGYWLNKWFLAGEPFRTPKSLAWDSVVLLVSILSGFGLAFPFSRMMEKRDVIGRRRLRNRLLVTICLVLGIPLCTVPLILSGHERDGASRATDKMPSVLLISIDALRADHLGCYGHSRSVSPRVDRLAKEGAQFLQAFCPVPSTGPSHATMLAGIAPQTHGVRENAYTLSDTFFTIAEMLRDEGYETAGFVTNPLIGTRFGFSQGFDTYVESGHVEKITSWKSGLLLQTLLAKEIYDKLAYQYLGAKDQTLLCLEKWMKRRKDKPFFIFLHLLDPHTPYTPLEPFLRMFPAEPIRDRDLLWILQGKDEELLARNISQYDGEVAQTDRKINSLFRFLEDRGLMENLIIVYTADHGENLGDHEPYFAHHDVFDSGLQVPLIIRWPRRIDSGMLIEEMVENRDIVPTVLSMVGLKVPACVEGKDLTPLFDGLRAPPRPYVIANSGKRYGLRNTEWKAVYDFASNESFLFDIRNDPGEREDRAGTENDQAEALIHTLRGEVKRLEKGDYISIEEDSKMEEMDRAMRERLRALGYLD